MKQTYTKGKPLTKCENCGRKIAGHQLRMHGKGVCSKEPTAIELKVLALKAKIDKLQETAKADRALPPAIQKQWDEYCAEE
ncbi:hypothetical protein [Candidatus Colwellia aromaticivorans]|uniref:hypothetical protein n=1 Tax=Candidatus Colwellia aromaticivorans TaxID=2267621 RepID=UPI000DF47B49|nr:hypothetical protein [Candidatus Colwellia aromaticivorans]